MKQEQRKVRKSKLEENEIINIAEVMKSRYCSFSEIQKMAGCYGLRGGIETILSLLAVRGYMVTEQIVVSYDAHNKKRIKKTMYKILTDQDYISYEEEATKDAKRRLLAAVSY